MKQRRVKLSPSILTADFGRLAEQIQAADAGGADAIHLDVMDGVFVPNISFGPLLVKAVAAVTRLPLDVHLMVADPDPYLAVFATAGANIITVHVEACRHLHRTVQVINSLGCQAGIALNPSTSIEAVREITPFVDLVLVMSVNPGFGGQKFIETTTGKLRRMRKLLEELNHAGVLYWKRHGVAEDWRLCPDVLRYKNPVVLVRGEVCQLYDYGKSEQSRKDVQYAVKLEV